MITVAILTKNNQHTIKNTLDSVKEFDEVVIIDSGSVDNTLEIAKNYKNVKITHSDFLGFSKLRNMAADLAKNDWIFMLDSDEEVSKELKIEIQKLKLDNNSIYSVGFHNFYNGKFIKTCGWYPEYHPRLYNKKITKVDDALIHECLIKKGLKVIKLKNPINHFSYGSIDDFLRKMQNYSTLFAKQNYKKKDSSLLKAISHGLFTFFKCYILKRGFMQGKEGFIISFYNANTTYYKYLKLDELNNR